MPTGPTAGGFGLELITLGSPVLNPSILDSINVVLSFGLTWYADWLPPRVRPKAELKIRPLMTALVMRSSVECAARERGGAAEVSPMYASLL